ncbi:MAG: histidinol dehydrogenase [Actinomycetota bacterium]|nr:histidinol dehydrogenase [Actinomycetota bacterium]
MRIARVRWDGEDPGAVVAGLRASAPPPPGLVKRVGEIVAAVRNRGDAALAELTVHLDGLVERRESHRVTGAALVRAREGVKDELAGALELAAANIGAVAEAELEAGEVELTLPQGQRVQIVARPIAAAGAYAPGGRAAYPSSVLMCCVPARVAGVERIVLATPPEPDGTVGAVTLAAAAIAGADEVYALGGAHAVAALALGTETIDPVDVVVGPGNAWVTEAKRQLFGDVGIDGLAGPSELAIVLDEGADTAQAVLDLMAQAEHGPDSPLLAISPDASALDRIAESIVKEAGERPTVAEAPLALIEVPSLESSLELIDAIAPEHLELRFDGADAKLAAERVAGCVFVGAGGATAFGDYAAGSNHVLPTAGRARFSGPLGARTFLRRTSVVTLTESAAAALAPAVETIARAEGLRVHGESATHRANLKGT